MTISSARFAHWQKPTMALFLLPVVSSIDICPGKFSMEGYGSVSLTNAGLNTDKGDSAAAVEMSADAEVMAHMNGRTYFSNECIEEGYSNTRYMALKLLGKTLKYTVNLNGAGCGCNAALYLTSLPQNTNKSDCLDYYCDANKVCGVACAEIDIQEANEHAWHSTLHAHDDGPGMGSVGGYGGNQARNWNAKEYGPGASCIDTSRPFEVSTSFPVDSHGVLLSMEIVLSQRGHSCTLPLSIGGYMVKGRDGMLEMTKALAAGMTPIISYWNSKEMLWLDGLGDDYKGPCTQDHPNACSDSVKFYGFSVEEIPPPCTEYCPVGRCDKHKNSDFCMWFTEAGAESYHCKVSDCNEAPLESSSISNCWKWNDQAFYSFKDQNAMCHDDRHQRKRERERAREREREGEREIENTLMDKEPQPTHKQSGLVRFFGAVVSMVVVSVVATVVGAFACRTRSTPTTHRSQDAHIDQTPPTARSQASPGQGTLRLISSREMLLVVPDETGSV